jgi:hypothetical protein
VNDLLKLAIEGHGGARRREEVLRFRAAATITGAIWALKGKPGPLDGVVLEGETRDPLAPFAGTTRRAPWDEFQVAYFAGEANWNYLVAPFIFARRDFVTEETAPWHEDGQVWRALLVTYPDAVVAHHRQQTYYFDDAGLLRRLDYRVDVLGGGPAVHYPSRYREFDGIMVPTRRRAYVRNPDGSPVLDSVSVAIDVTDVTFN